MDKLISVDALKKYIDDCTVCDNCDKKQFMCSIGCTFPDCITPMWERALNEQPTVDAIPIKWLTEQADSPSNSDELRNAIDYIVYTLWAERREPNTHE